LAASDSLLAVIEMENKSELVHNDSRECIHHWIIDVMNLGVCKKCGVSKQFSVSWSAASLRNACRRENPVVQHNAP
jgi:hypothetical protein